MEKNNKLTREQVIFLTFIGIVGNIVYIHTWIDDNTDRSAWVACFLGILLVIPFAVWIFYLGKYYPNGTVFDIVESGLGKFLGSIVCIVFILINIAVAVTHLNMFTAMINVFFLQYTPSWIIILFIVVMGGILANSGMQVFGRLVELLCVIGLINYFSAFVFVSPQNFHTEYIIPIFNTSLIGFAKGTIFMIGASSECLLLLMIIVKYIPDSKKHYKWAIKGIVLGATVFPIAIMVIIGILSPELAKRIAFGGVNAAKLIQVGELIRGLEVLILVTYQFIAIGKITICMYCAWIASKKVFNEKIPRIQLVLIAIIIFVASVWIDSYNTAYYLAVGLGKYIILPFSVFVLLLASIGIVIKNKSVGSESK